MKLIDKDALVTEIERLKSIQLSIFSKGKTKERCYDSLTCISVYNEIFSFIDTLEVKEVDLEKEVEKSLKRHSMLAVGKKDFADIAKHFFELGLKTQHSSINIANIDDLFEEDGINPYSKDAKLFKECYYTALEKLKEKKIV